MHRRALVLSTLALEVMSVTCTSPEVQILKCSLVWMSKAVCDGHLLSVIDMNNQLLTFRRQCAADGTWHARKVG